MMCRVPRNWGSRLMLSSIPFGQCVCSFLSVLNAIVRFQRLSMTDFQVLESENMFSLLSVRFVLFKSFFLNNTTCKSKHDFGSCTIFFTPLKVLWGGFCSFVSSKFLLGICQSTATRSWSAALSRYGSSRQRQDKKKRSSSFHSTS